MGISKGAALLSLALIFQGCAGMTEVENSEVVLSLYPPFTEEELVVVPQLLGWWEFEDWEDADRAERFIISNPEGKVLLVCSVEDEVMPWFFARTTKVDDDTLFVMRPGYRGLLPLAAGEKFLWIPGHALAQLRVFEDHLMGRLLLKDRFLRSVSKDPRNTLKYEDTDERILITSDGSTLRDYLRRKDNWEDMFTPWMSIARRTGAGEGVCSHLPPPPPPPPTEEGTAKDTENLP